MKLLNVWLYYLSLISIIKFGRQSSLNHLSHLSRTFEDRLKSLFQESLKYKFVIDDYERFLDRKYFTLKKVDAEKIVANYSSQLGKLLEKKMSSIKKVVKFAENMAANYTWNDSLSVHDVQYINAKHIFENDTRMSRHPLFGKGKIVLNESSVHIPTEIYEGDNEILNAIKWSQTLDKIWKQNRKDDPNLLWQYFASQRGIFRTFPGLRWRNEGVDMYDVRRRPWYVQGSSSPKDVLIMIDTSGSMHGRSLQLTKLSVKKLIDAMGENDYVAVAQYPGQFLDSVNHKGRSWKYFPHFLLDKKGDKDAVCFKTFVQATKRNKDRLFTQLERISAFGIAEIDDAVDFAFNAFKEFDSLEDGNNQGAKCNRLIVIFTDGGTHFPGERLKIFHEENKHYENIRVFAYSVGEQVDPVEALRELACTNKGYFAPIPSIGAVANIIQDVSTVLSRPMTLAAGKFFVWHNIYLDSLGSGLMTSLTLPVYNRTGNKSLLGVIGTDATLKDLMDLIPTEKLGPNGYAFAINTNGYTIFHPELRAQRGWMRDPPNVDFLELEFDSEMKQQVRREIINHTTQSKRSVIGSTTLDGFIKVVDEIHTYKRSRIYAYTGINSSTFGLCVVIPPDNVFYPDFSNHQSIYLTKRSPGVFIILEDHKERPLGILNTSDILLTTTLIRKHCFWSSNHLPYPTANQKRSDIPLNRQSQDEPVVHYSANENAPRDDSSRGVRLDLKLFNTTSSRSGVGGGASSTGGKTDSPPSPSLEEHQIVNSEQLLTMLTNRDTPCGSYFTSHFLTDLLIAQMYLDRLAQTHLQYRSSLISVVLTFNSGLSVVWPKSHSWRYQEFTQEESGLYQRTMDSSDLIFWVPIRLGAPDVITNHSTVSNYFMEDEQEETPLPQSPPTIPSGFQAPVSIFMRLEVNQRGHSYKPAVIGMTIQEEFIHSIFSSNILCNSPEVNTCYLLEDAAYIIAVNNPAYEYQIGYFLGYIDAPLMNSLLNTSMYARIREYDYQGTCRKTQDYANSPYYSASTSSAAFLTSFSISSNSIKYIDPIFWLHLLKSVLEAVAMVLKFSVLLFVTPTVSGQETTATTSNSNQSCIKLAYRYYLPTLGSKDQGRLQVEGNLVCGTCEREFSAQRILGTNLVLAVVTPLCRSCSELEVQTPIAQTPLRDPVKDPGPDICQQSTSPRYRLRPSQCYNFDPNEDSSKCTGHSFKPFGPFLISLVLSTTCLIFKPHLLLPFL